MLIKQEIGKRISEARKAKKLTRKALSALTEDLKPSRINNWERGIRTPGPEEIKQLAAALNMPPAYLMGLEDEPIALQDSHQKFIPLLTLAQACDILVHFEKCTKIYPLISVNGAHIGSHFFAIKIQDTSMSPELRLNDLLIITPEQKPRPGDFVVVKTTVYDEAVIRQYKPLSTEKNNPEFELLAFNPYWPPINSKQTTAIIGTVFALQRNLFQ